MDIKKTALNAASIVFAALAFLSLFGSLIFLMSGYELDSLHVQADAFYPPKLAGIVDSFIPAELENFSVQDLRLACMLRGAIGPGELSGLPLGESDIDLICNSAKQTDDRAELEQMVVREKFTQTSSDAFGQIKDGVNSYSYTYLPVLLVTMALLFLLSALCAYLAEGEVAGAVRTLALACGALGGAYFLGLAVSWLLIPSVIGSEVDSLISTTYVGTQTLSEQISVLPPGQRAAVELLVADSVVFLDAWIRDALVHFMLVYLAIAIGGGAVWAGAFAFSRLGKGEEFTGTS